VLTTPATRTGVLARMPNFAPTAHDFIALLRIFRFLGALPRLKPTLPCRHVTAESVGERSCNVSASTQGGYGMASWSVAVPTGRPDGSPRVRTRNPPPTPLTVFAISHFSGSRAEHCVYGLPAGICPRLPPIRRTRVSMAEIQGSRHRALCPSMTHQHEHAIIPRLRRTLARRAAWLGRHRGMQRGLPVRARWGVRDAERRRRDQTVRTCAFLRGAPRFLAISRQTWSFDTSIDDGACCARRSSHPGPRPLASEVPPRCTHSHSPLHSC